MRETRELYKRLLNNFLADQIKQFRTGHGLTQEVMSEHLCMEPRSYIYLEKKRYGCSALTLMRFLMQLTNEERSQFIHAVCTLMENGDHHDAA